jgi:hypothetical protein
MSLPSIGQSVSNGISPPPSHQTIGRNGSFWLPQKINQSFDSKVKNTSQSKEGSKQGASKGADLGKSGSGEKSTARISFLGSRTTVAGNSPPKGKSLNAPSFASSKFGSMSAKAPQLKSLLSSPVNSGRPVSSEQVIHGQQAKTMRHANRNTAHPEVNSRDSVSPDQERKENGGKHGERRGAKNALLDSKMDIAQSQQDFKVLEGQVSRDPVPSVPPKARAFLQFLSNSVAPRMAYLDKNTRKVVRFAVDLPNKTKLGVRLEESGDALSLCFICSDPESLEMLGFTKDVLSKSLADQSGKVAQINIFNNYKEMDEHFSRAA